MRCRRLLLLSLFSLLLWTACSGGTSEDPAGASAAASDHGSDHGAHGEISWYDGSVDEAFAFAKSENRPLFLYWGAVWCPPCHYLKTKIFPREEFVEASRELVMVYLDGDTERAQVYGERFGVRGYPTVILFDAGGQEMTRLPSTMPVDQYSAVLDKAMARLRPITEIYADVRSEGAASADPTDLHLLAFYSWGQDQALDLEPAEKLAAFGELYRGTPADLGAERTRFLSLYLMDLVSAEDAPDIAEDERAALYRDLLALLADPAQVRNNLDLVHYANRDVVQFFHPQPSAERDALIETWNRAARTVGVDETLSTDDRLTALLPQIWLAPLRTGAGEALPAELLDHVRERIAWASSAVSGEGEMQAVMSTMAGVLQEASLDDEAETLLTERMGEALAPYYYMGWLASIKKSAGKTDEAIDLYRQAHANADGAYTRFRYGSSYLKQLMELRPEDAATVAAESERILDELLQHDDAFAGGNHSRLESLAEAYLEWNEDGSHDAVLDAVRAKIHGACDRYPEDGDQRARCASFLSAEDSADRA